MEDYKRQLVEALSNATDAAIRSDPDGVSDSITESLKLVGAILRPHIDRIEYLSRTGIPETQLDVLLIQSACGFTFGVVYSDDVIEETRANKAKLQ